MREESRRGVVTLCSEGFMRESSEHANLEYSDIVGSIMLLLAPSLCLCVCVPIYMPAGWFKRLEAMSRQNPCRHSVELARAWLYFIYLLSKDIFDDDEEYKGAHGN
ncbi:hypothetical protein PV326_001719, partial [Microctonus aethiopoides]